MIDYENFDEYKSEIEAPQGAINPIDKTLEFLFLPDESNYFQKFIQVSPENRVHFFNVYWDGQFDEYDEEVPLTKELILDELSEVLPEMPTYPSYASLLEVMESM